jgi:hypothetical protein
MPTETRLPANTSEMVGNMVANRTNAAQPSITQLLRRKANSREVNDSNDACARSLGAR